MLEFCWPKILVSIFQEYNNKKRKITKAMVKTRKPQVHGRSLNIVWIFPYWDKRDGPSLQFNLVSLNMKFNADSMTLGGCKWLERIHTFEYIWLRNQNAQNYKQTWKNENALKKEPTCVTWSMLHNISWRLSVKNRLRLPAPEWNIKITPACWNGY